MRWWLLSVSAVVGLGWALAEPRVAMAASPIPGRIQAEDYDAGGQGVGYFDSTPGNNGGIYRSDSVDIGHDFPDDGTFEVGWIVAGEWLRYTLQVGQSGSYVLRLRMAQHLAGGRFHVVLDGVTVTPQLASPDTGTYRHWVTLPVATLALSAGAHTLYLVFDQNGLNGGVMNLNWLELTPRATSLPGRVQAEDFDPVAGVGHYDTSPSNITDSYRRSEAVDIGSSFPDDDWSPSVEYIAPGEWLQYTVQIGKTGEYAMRARLASEVAGGALAVEVDGVSAGTIQVPTTTSYANWITLPLLTRSLSAGQHTIRLTFAQNAGMNLNWFELAPENPVIVENRLPGSSAWRDQGDITYDDSLIKGYASATSVNRGGSLTFYVHVGLPRNTVTMQIFRVGYYDGANARLITTEYFSPQIQPPCGAGSSGQIECDWIPSYTLAVPQSWPSGVYVAKVTTSVLPPNLIGNYIPFVVRDDARTADFLYVQPVTTYQAYNNYPSTNCVVAEGKSLYDWNSSGGRAARVSFRRPLCGNGSGGGAGGGSITDEVFDHEMNLIAFLERQGLDVTYATSIDLHRTTPARLARYRAILSVSHDEYWTTAMRDNVEEARDRGVHLAFFAGNAAYWQVRLEDGDQTIVCYKTEEVPFPEDPIPFWPLKTVQFRSVGRPEQWLIGIQYENACCQAVDTYFPLGNLFAESWVFGASPTPITPSTLIPLTVGHEVDSFNPATGLPVFVFDGTATLAPLNPPRIEPTRYQTLATGIHYFNVCPGCPHDVSIYQAPSGAWVFATGTLGWALDLANVGRYFQESDIIQNATWNVLSRFLAGPNPSEATNLALGATVLARSSLEEEWWSAAGVVDGRRNAAFGTSLGYSSEYGWPGNHAEWVELRLPAPRLISRVILFPRNDADFAGRGFPTDLEIQIWNGSAWINWSSFIGYPQPPTTGQSFAFAPATTDAIRIYATSFSDTLGQYRLALAEIELYGPDSDGDGANDDIDNCPTVVSADVTDVDGDGVGDACDNCVNAANPRMTPDAETFLAANPWATLTGGQRDDDHDGFGNVCDGDFPGTGTATNVNAADTAQYKASIGKPRTGDSCGTLGTRPCAIYDLNLAQHTDNVTNISAADTARYKTLLGLPPGPKCVACTGTGSLQLPCAAGAAGGCN